MSFVQKPYRLKVIKCGARLSFHMGYGAEWITSFSWKDDGETFGPMLGNGKIGFRQMTPLIAEYSDLVMHKVEVA